MESKIGTESFLFTDQLEWDKPADGIKRQILGYDSDVMMVRFVFQKGAVGEAHSHPHRQVSYVESGSFELCIDGESKILNKGDGYFVSPDVVHSAVCLEDGCLIDTFVPMREDFVE